ncbi:hypothetical protein V6N12_058192 [Hibiscus sabdariffa]|uniref:Uncharacterized protein n=1 Tax=Hibiscus sabdariffa TaxID=183260 RepID=A0ABR2ERD1_9ROSI
MELYIRNDMEAVNEFVVDGVEKEDCGDNGFVSTNKGKVPYANMVTGTAGTKGVVARHPGVIDKEVVITQDDIQQDRNGNSCDAFAPTSTGQEGDRERCPVPHDQPIEVAIANTGVVHSVVKNDAYMASNPDRKAKTGKKVGKNMELVPLVEGTSVQVTDHVVPSRSGSHQVINIVEENDSPAGVAAAGNIQIRLSQGMAELDEALGNSMAVGEGVNNEHEMMNPLVHSSSSEEEYLPPGAVFEEDIRVSDKLLHGQ